MKYFVDWARKKPWAILSEDGKLTELPRREVADFFTSGDEIYIESGVSANLMYDLIEKGCMIFKVHSKRVHELRNELGFEEKTDIADAYLIRSVYEIYPELFIEMEEPDENDLELRRLNAQYKSITKDIVKFKNIRSATKWEYGDNPYEGAIEALEKGKKDLFKKIKPLIKEDLKKVKTLEIKGIGPQLLAQLLAVAHPKNYPSMSKYLADLGCKASTFYKTFEDGVGKGRGTFRRGAKTVIWMMANQVIMAKDPKYYKFYNEMKEKFKKEDPDRSDGICHGKALNRLQTMLLKEIYKRLT